MQITFKIIQCIIHANITNFCSNRHAPKENRFKIPPTPLQKNKDTKKQTNKQNSNTRVKSVQLDIYHV
jgi:hypothetical protein